MSPLPPVDRARNRQLIAERLDWPDGALDACIAIENDHPQWAVYWVSGTTVSEPRRGYRAVAQVRWRIARAFGETPEELREAIEGAPA